MKHCSKLLTILVLIAYTNFINAQTMDTTVRKMLDMQLINEMQAEKLEEIIQIAGPPHPPSFYLYMLWQFQYFPDGKIQGSPLGLHDQLWHLEKAAEKIEVTKTVQDTLTDYLKQLRHSGLLTDRQFSRHAEKVKQKEYRSIPQILGHLYTQGTYDEAISPDRLLQFSPVLAAIYHPISTIWWGRSKDSYQAVFTIYTIRNGDPSSFFSLRNSANFYTPANSLFLKKVIWKRRTDSSIFLTGPPFSPDSRPCFLVA